MRWEEKRIWNHYEFNELLTNIKSDQVFDLMTDVHSDELLLMSGGSRSDCHSTLHEASTPPHSLLHAASTPPYSPLHAASTPPHSQPHSPPHTTSTSSHSPLHIASTPPHSQPHTTSTPPHSPSHVASTPPHSTIHITSTPPHSAPHATSTTPHSTLHSLPHADAASTPPHSPPYADVASTPPQSLPQPPQPGATLYSILEELFNNKFAALENLVKEQHDFIENLVKEKHTLIEQLVKENFTYIENLVNDRFDKVQVEIDSLKHQTTAEACSAATEEAAAMASTDSTSPIASCPEAKKVPDLMYPGKEKVPTYVTICIDELLTNADRDTRMKRSLSSEKPVTIALDDSSDSDSEADKVRRAKRGKKDGGFKNLEHIMSQDTLIRMANMYQDYMKRIPIPTFSGSVIPFTSWLGLARSLKQLYGQPLHYLTNALLKQWDRERFGSDTEHQALDSVVHPVKAQTLIWLTEEFHRLTASPYHLAQVWASDPMYHSLIDPFSSQ